jgi:hypothetical protein
MKQTIKIKDAQNMMTGLQAINKHFPVKMNYAIVRNLKNLAVECKTAEEQRNKIIQDNVLKDEKGNAVTKDGSYEFKDSETQARVIKEINDIGEVDIEIEVMMLPMSILEQCDSDSFDSVSSRDMEALEFMIEE